ncbi:Parp protein [Dirofilaria immitis]|nr:Parp protein [Dirofilaria immitis]
MASLAEGLFYSTEYAKSNRAVCKGCHGLIAQGSLRMSFRKPSRFFDGLQDNWFHFTCFWKKVKRNNINEASVRGMEFLKWSDQERIRKKIIENQAGVYCAKELSLILIAEYAPTGRSKCVNCKENIRKTLKQLQNTLRLGMKSAWYHVSCFEETQQYIISIEKFVADIEISAVIELNQELLHLLKRSKTKMDQPDTEEKMKRLQAQANEIWSVKKKLSKCLSKNDIQTLLLANNQALPKHDGVSKSSLDHLVDCMVFGCPLPCEQCKGSNIVYSSSERTYVCSGYISEYTRCMYTCRNPPRKPFLIPDKVKKSISEFENFEVKDPKNREYSAPEHRKLIKSESFKVLGQNVSQMSSEFMNYGNADSRDLCFGMQRQIVKNGMMVDTKCLLQEVVHVWKDENGKFWETTLGKADFQTGANSFYKLQLLKHDIKQKYYLFRSWGRVGTNIGGVKTDKYNGDLEGAKITFEKLFNEKTANNWNDVGNFRKVPGRCHLLKLTPKQIFVGKSGSSSKLPEPIQQIVKMVFDVDAMSDTLNSLEIDTNKMPLGILSIRHIKNAYKILTELQKLMEVSDAKYKDYLDATNRFFTLIPHNFGMNKPPLLNSQKLLIDKTKLLDDLLELEITYRILRTSDEADPERDPVDVYYEKLHAQLEVLDKQSDEYKYILQYAANTHAPTHDQYELEIIDGLRVAPPEAPTTGYMFGKGIYFADLISKSANYCYAINTEGFILLCEVALGEIQEEVNAKSIAKPDSGKNSVKGLGQMVPDPNEYFVTEDGVTIPMGKLIDAKDGI